MKRGVTRGITLVLGIMLGLLISFNSDFDGIKKYFSLNYREYNEAALDRNDLYKEIESLKKANGKTKALIDKYDNLAKDDGEVVKIMKEQGDYLGLIRGEMPVEGPGILVKISDGDIYDKNLNSLELSNRIFHDRDVNLVLNELRKAGAEAIMINNYRIGEDTGLSCNGPFIIFDDEHTEYAPFYFYAIGNPEEMEASILSEGSHIKELQLRELSITIEKVKTIKMPGVLNGNSSEFLQENLEKDKK